MNVVQGIINFVKSVIAIFRGKWGEALKYLLKAVGFFAKAFINIWFKIQEFVVGIMFEIGNKVVDRANGKAYCALSPRADEELFIEFCEDFEFTPVIFEAFQTVNGERKHIYHTNVIMCVGETFAVICADCIDDKKERKMVLDSLKGDEKEVILITEDQVNNFAGNMLEVKGNDDRRYLIMSASAHQSLTKKQIAQLEEHVTIVSSSLDTIDACPVLED